MTTFSPLEIIRRTSILLHSDVKSSVGYLAKKDDKFLLWRDFKAVVDMLDELQMSYSALYDPLSSGQLIQELTKVYTDYTKELVSAGKVVIAPSVVDGVIYETAVRSFAPTVPRTVGRTWYPTLRLHMKLFAYETQTHPVYGEYVGWTAGLIKVD
jgi:hypothetical protein